MYAMIKFILAAFLVLISGSSLIRASPTPRSGTSSEGITYILPIWEGSLATHAESADLGVLNDMKTALGLGGSGTKLGWSFSSWALSRDIQSASNDYNFDPANLNYMLGLAVQSNLPILVHMNNGRWADCCTPNSDGGWGDSLLDFIASHPNTTMLDNTGASQYGHDGGSNYFSLSRLNTVYRNYKKRNVQASASIIASWAAANPSMFAGVSLSSETLFPRNQVDYSPIAIDEWKQWMRGTGIYGPGGQYFGAGRVPAFKDIYAFNNATGQAFASWSTMQPPSSVVPGDPFGEEWERWRVQMIINTVSDETLWIAFAGIDRNLIYGHQTSRGDDYNLADSVETETAANGAGGVTYYGWDPVNFSELDNPMRGVGKNNFGVSELNPLSTNFTTCYETVRQLYDHGAKIICPNSWESDEAVKDQYAIFGSPEWGDNFGLALHQFLLDYGDKSRYVEPPAWNPGNRIHNLYDSFSSATSTGPDNHLEAAGSVSNVVRKSIYSAVEGIISYTVDLPQVSSERLNLWTSVGIQDGTPIGGEVQFQILINGSPLLGRGFHLNKNYWVWNRWVPIMIDITAWAGSTVTLEFHTTGNPTYGNTIWGSPAIYQSTTTSGNAASNNLALGATVRISSQDGVGVGWDSHYLTDGNVDGGVDGRNGWSSMSHSSPSATEWAIVDLGASQSIGKVVLFARSDLVDFSGTGFPTAFEVQGSSDSQTWTTLVKLTEFPMPEAGHGQILTFPSANARYVRVLATELGGVGNESGYRFQLAELEIYA